MGRCFTTNYAIAVGIGHAGSPLGLIIMAPLIQLFLDTYGWRGTMLLLGGINLNIAVCGALLCQPSTRGSQEVKYTPVPSSVEECKTKPRGIFLKETLMTIKTRSGISVCFTLSFWIPTFIFICNGTTGILWFAYFIDHVQAKGFTAYDAVLFTTVGGLANVIIKILTGPIIDRGILPLRAALVIYTLAASTCLIVDPWMNSYWLMVVNVFILYGSLGTVGALVDILTRELVGPELLANVFSWMKFVSGVAFFCSGFFPGNYPKIRLCTSDIVSEIKEKQTKIFVSRFLLETMSLYITRHSLLSLLMVNNYMYVHRNQMGFTTVILFM